MSVSYGSEALNIIFDDGYDEFWDFAEVDDYGSSFNGGNKGGVGKKNGNGYGWPDKGGEESASKPTSSHGS